ncbi:unnamed protein product, partial [Ectocarpus sp. 8 AP-2014]
SETPPSDNRGCRWGAFLGGMWNTNGAGSPLTRRSTNTEAVSEGSWEASAVAVWMGTVKGGLYACFASVSG